MWTYDGDPTGDRKDEVRFLVGDTDINAQMVQDEEIALLLTQFAPEGTKPAWLAAAACCDAIAGRLARKMQQSLGPLSASFQQQYEHYMQLAQQFRVLYATNGLGIVGGAAGNMVGVKAAAPVLSGGGPTVLGGGSYTNSGDGAF